MSPRLIFLGSKAAGLIAIKKILEDVPRQCVSAVICPDDILDERSERPAFKALANKYSLPLCIANTSTDASRLIRRYAPDIVLVHGWYRMLDVSSLAGIKFYGFHFSSLPEYRGNAPLVWQILNGRDQIGVSFFSLTDGMDDGEIVDQRNFSLSVDESIGDALEKANDLVLQMLDDFLPRWLAGTIVTRPQASSPVSYCGMRMPSDGLIEWRDSSAKVRDFIRAQSRPYPGAFSRMPDGRVVRIWKVKADDRTFYGVPGSILEVGSGFIVIACGSGALRILHAELDGKPDFGIPRELCSMKVRLS
jgi:methionyl-tRNA formyltransferase